MSKEKGEDGSMRRVSVALILFTLLAGNFVLKLKMNGRWRKDREGTR
jgi:hypothetical protein